jgi:hypothetical protein
MATDTTVANPTVADTAAARNPPAGDTQAPDYSTARTARALRINPEARIAPTCMIWSMVISIGLIVLIVVTWGIANISTIFR